MSDDPTERSPWWRVVEEHLEQWEEASHEDLADPWADHEAPTVALTEAQRALLLGDHDQPAPPRLSSGADADQPGVARLTGSDEGSDRSDDEAGDAASDDAEPPAS